MSISAEMVRRGCVDENDQGVGVVSSASGGDDAPFNTWDFIPKLAAGVGYKGVQISSRDGRLFDLEKAAASKTYCDEIMGIAQQNGDMTNELSTHLQGQLVAVHPAFDGFAPGEVHGNARMPGIGRE